MSRLIICQENAHTVLVLLEVTSATPRGLHGIFRRMWAHEEAAFPHYREMLGKEVWYPHDQIVCYDASEEDYHQLTSLRKQLLEARGAYTLLVNKLAQKEKS